MNPPLVILKTGSTTLPPSAREGDFEDWIRAGLDLPGQRVRVVDAEHEPELPPPSGVAAVVITCSPAMITDRPEWVDGAAARRDPLFEVLPERFPAAAAHSQSVLGVPPGAGRLAESPGVRVQACRYGPRAWGVQFHPEFSVAVLSAYAVKDGAPDRVLAAIRPSPADALLARFRQMAR